MSLLFSWLILLPPRVGWDIMRYESEPLPSYHYHELRNCSYSIVLNYTESPSTPQVHLPRFGTTISPPGLSLASAPFWCRVHKWGGRPRFPIWLPVASFVLPYGVEPCVFYFHYHRGVSPPLTPHAAVIPVIFLSNW